MSAATQKTAKTESFARLEESIVCDPNLTHLDVRILGLALCRTKGASTADSLKRFNASDIARAFGMSDRHAIIESLKRYESKGVLVRQPAKPGTKSVYGLRLDDYLSRITQAKVQTCGDSTQHLCELEHPLDHSKSKIRKTENVALKSRSNLEDCIEHGDSDSVIAPAPEESLTCVESTQVGSGIAPAWADEAWALEHLNNLGGPYWVGTEREYQSMMSLGSTQAFIDAVYLLDVRTKRGMQMRKNAEDWVADAIKKRYELNGADRTYLAKRDADIDAAVRRMNETGCSDGIDDELFREAARRMSSMGNAA